MATMTISEARAALADVLDRAGRGEEITITRHGRPVAVVPAGLAVVSSPPATVPGPPGTLAASASSGAVTLSWSAPSSNGGSAVVGYAIFKGTTYDGESSTPVNSSPVATTSYTVTGLTNGTTYYFTVEAVNALGASAASNQASATPMAGPPPVTLYATPSGSATSGCTSSTVSDNTASATGYPGGSGAGIFSHHSTSATVVVTLAGSIVADQAHGSNCHGSVIDAGYNLSNGTSCGFGTAFPAPPGSKDSVANLDLASSLASHGGPTETIALGAHSAADTAISSPAMATLGGVSVNLCSDTSYETAAGVNADLALDQRGVSRPATGCSAGAYQAALTVPGAPTALTAELKRLAEKPSLEEVLDRIERHSGGRVGLGQAAVDLAEQRTNR